MKVSELKHMLDFAQEEDVLVIAVNLPYVTVGGKPVITVESASSAFDWDRGKFILFPKENLTPSDRDFEARMKKMQEELGWLKCENRNLKAEIRKLKQTKE